MGCQAWEMASDSFEVQGTSLVGCNGDVMK